MNNRIVLTLLGVALSVCVVSCAPEPVAEEPAPRATDDVTETAQPTPEAPGTAGDSEQGAKELEVVEQLDEERTQNQNGGGTLIEGRKPVDLPKSTVLPGNFPTVALPVSPNAVIYDVGSRNAQEWFVVLEGASLDDANGTLREFVSAGGFSQIHEETRSDGAISGEYESPQARIEAFTFINDDGIALVNIEARIK